MAWTVAGTSRAATLRRTMRSSLGLVGPPEDEAYPALLSGLDLHGAASGSARVVWEYGGFNSQGWEATLDVLDLATNGRTGTIDLGVDGLVISWTLRGRSVARSFGSASQAAAPGAAELPPARQPAVGWLGEPGERILGRLVGEAAGPSVPTSAASPYA